MNAIEKEIIKGAKKFAKVNNMQKKSTRSIEEIDDGNTMSFSDYLSQELGTPGTEKRKVNDAKIDKIQKEMVAKEKAKKNKL